MADESPMIECLVGAWELREWSEIRPDGSKSYPSAKTQSGRFSTPLTAIWLRS
jgi:hypothetical protein